MVLGFKEEKKIRINGEFGHWKFGSFSKEQLLRNNDLLFILCLFRIDYYIFKCKIWCMSLYAIKNMVYSMANLMKIMIN